MENNDEAMEGVEAIEPIEVQIWDPNVPEEVIEQPIEPVDLPAVQEDQNAGNLQEIQIDNAGANESENEEEPTENRNKRKEFSDCDEDDKDSGEACPICTEEWNNSGDHRLCSLRCGHLFGYSCIKRWIQTGCNAGARRCPQCNSKATMKDIRVLYAQKLRVIDNSETDRLKEELNSITKRKNELEMEVAKYVIREKLFEQQLAGMKQRIIELENQQLQIGKEFQTPSQLSSTQQSTKKFYLERSIDIAKNGECRVLDYNPSHEILVVSHKSTNNLFSGYAIKKIDSREFRSRQFVCLHSKQIRDVSFNPTKMEILLSVGFDKFAKLMDVRCNSILHSFLTDSQLWSCCWAGDNHNILSVGGSNGSITQYDIRQTGGPMNKTEGPDRSPVVSLASIEPNSNGGMPRGGFVACRLNTCFTYEAKNDGYEEKQMFLTGPFVSVCYNSESKHIVVSARPNSACPQVRHTVCTIERGNEDLILCNVVHTFQGGNSLKLLSRPCQIKTEDDTLLAAHNEATSSVPIWSLSTGKQVFNLRVSDPVLDFCSFNTGSNELFLATLSESKLRAYKYNN